MTFEQYLKSKVIDEDTFLIDKHLANYDPDFHEFRESFYIEGRDLKEIWDYQQTKIEQLEKQNKEMLNAIKASCEYDDSWISQEKYDSNYYEGDPDFERYKIFKQIIKERGE